MTVHRVEMIQKVFFSMQALRPIFHLPALPFWEKLAPTQIPWLQYCPIQMANKMTLILRFLRNEPSSHCETLLSDQKFGHQGILWIDLWPKRGTVDVKEGSMESKHRGWSYHKLLIGQVMVGSHTPSIQLFNKFIIALRKFFPLFLCV